MPRPRAVQLVDEADGLDLARDMQALIGLDDSLWSEWRGPSDDRPSRKLTQGELSRLLRPFDIRRKTIWPVHRRLGDKSSRGYLRSQFEATWRAYCPSADTPTQPSKIISLPLP
jgi:hypothetical protein